MSRRPLHQIDPDIVKRIEDAIRVGNYVEDACEYAGLSRHTLYSWLRRGQAEMDRINDGQDPDPAEAIYLTILTTIEKARAEAVVRNVTLIQNAARDGSWQAAAWWLERTRSAHFGRRLATEVSGPGGGPVALEVVTPEALDARISALLGEQDGEEEE
jgi:hypothetical protein